jgi:cytochrome P450
MATMNAIDLFDPRIRTNPYPLYEALRETGDGIYRLEALNGWLFTRYADVEDILKDRSSWSSDYFGTDIGMGSHDPSNPTHRRWAAIASQNLLATDPPKHTRLRTLLSHAFSARALRAWSEAITESIDEVLFGIAPDMEVDAVGTVATVLPVWVISKLIGVPIADRQRFHRMSLALTETFDVTVQEERRDRAIEDSLELFDYVRELAETRRSDGDFESSDDLLSTLLRAEESGERLTMDELLATVGILLVAGNETTTDTIGNGIGLLLRHPDQMIAMRDHRELIDKAVLEILRMESPIQLAGRKAASDFEYRGRAISKGVNAFVCIGAANRDPRAFDRADEFDVSRGGTKHLAFGRGAHLCIGSQLARIQVRMLFNELFDRFPSMQAGKSEPVMRSDRLLQRGYEQLPVVFGSA